MANVTQVAQSGGNTYFIKDSVAREQISDEATAREDAISNLENTLNIMNVDTEWKDGKYFDANGVLQGYNTFQASEKISTKDSTGLINRNIHIKVKLNSAANVIFYDGNMSFIKSETTSETGDVIFETDTAHVQGCRYVAVSNMKSYTPQIWASYSETDIRYLLNLLPEKWNLFDKNSPDNEENKFINDDAIISLNDYMVSHLIPIRGGVSYTYDQPTEAFGSEAHYAICSPEGKMIKVVFPQIVNNKVTFTEEESCYIRVNIYTKGTFGINDFRFCETANKDKPFSEYRGRLTGKKILYNGDSITESRNSGFASNGGGFPKLISDITGGTYQNRAVGGGTLAVNGTSHNICTDIANMDDDGDLICLEGGINDYWGNVPLGVFSESSFTDEIDNTTICGAMEYIFRQAINKWIGKPIVFIIVHKISDTAWVNNREGYSFADAREKMIAICEKYSIPYLDMWAEGGLTAYMEALNSAYLNGGATQHPDGCHPDVNGYKKYYVPRLISLFESVLPYDD